MKKMHEVMQNMEGNMRNMKKLTAVICAVVATLSIAACGSSSEGTITSTTVATPTLSNETKAAEVKTTAAAGTSATLAAPATGTEKVGTGYSLTFPATWVESTSAGCDMVMMNSACTSTSFTTNINVVIEDVSAYGTMTSETYCEAAKSQFANTTGYTVTGTQKCSVNGVEAYTLTCDAVQSGISYKIKQLYVVSGGKAYVTTFSAGADGTYEKDVVEGDSIFATFQVK